MNKYLCSVFIATIVLFTRPVLARASQNTAGSSASIALLSSKTRQAHIQKLAIANVLKRYHSPMATEADTFVTVAQKNNLNPFILPAIAGVESGFGRALVKNSHNPFGWGGGHIHFDSWEEGIDTVGTGLSTRYFTSENSTLYTVGPRYAGGSTSWAPKVASLVRTFEAEQARIERYFVL